MPPQPLDRVPGTVPSELSENDNYELFVPADIQPDILSEQHLMNLRQHQQYGPASQRTHSSHGSPRTSLDRKRRSD